MMQTAIFHDVCIWSKWYSEMKLHILFAGDVSAKPSEHKRDPAIATLRYENSFNNGPTNKPEKFIITS